MTAVKKKEQWVKDTTKPSDLNAILDERGARYGKFVGHARVTQNIKNAMADSPNWSKLPAYQKEALEMIAHKFGRMLNGDFMYEDNLIDVLGYATLALEETKAANTQME